MAQTNFLAIFAPNILAKVKTWLTGKYVEETDTASQNIPAGKWVTWKGQVCKAKTTITAGDVLSSSNLGTNEEGIANGLFFQFRQYDWLYGTDSPINTGSFSCSGYKAILIVMATRTDYLTTTVPYILEVPQDDSSYTTTLNGLVTGAKRSFTLTKDTVTFAAVDADTNYCLPRAIYGIN